VRTTGDGVEQRDYVEGKNEKSAREVFFYYSGPKPSAVRYKNWKMYYAMVPTSPVGAMVGAQTYAWTQVNNIARDPFEIAGGNDHIKTTMQIGGALASPGTAYLDEWMPLPLGQAVRRKQVATYKAFAALKQPASS